MLKKTTVVLIFLIFTVLPSAPFLPSQALLHASEKVEISPQAEETDFITSTAVSPDGKYLVTGGYDHTIRLWDIMNGREVRKFSGHSSAVNAVTFSRDGRLIVSGGSDETVRIWDVSTGKEIKKFTVEFKYNTLFIIHNYKAPEVNAVAMSPDGRYIAASCRDREDMRRFDASTGKLLNIDSLNSLTASLAFSPDGRFILGGGKDVRLYDASSGESIRRFAGWNGHWDFIRSVAFSPDGRYALSGSDDETLRLWDIATGKMIRKFKGHKDWVRSVAFSPDGKHILSGSADKTVRLWDSLTGKEVKTVAHLPYPVASIAVTPDSRFVIYAGKDGRAGISEIASSRELAQFFTFKNGEWAVVNPEGYYNSSENGDKYVKVSADKHTFTLQQYREALFRPEFVKLALASMISGPPAKADSSESPTVVDLAKMDERKLSEEKGLAEQRRLEEEKRQAELKKREDEKRLAEEKRIREEEQRLVEQKELEAERRIAEQKRLEGERAKREKQIAEAKRKEEELKLADEKKLKEQELRLAEQRRLEEERLPKAPGLARFTDIKVPPAVSIVNTPEETRKAEINLTLKIENKGGGIGDIRIYLNETAVLLENARALKIIGAKDSTILKTYALKLVKGKNTVRAVAFNEDNTMSSADALHTIVANFETIRRPSLYALVIGIQKFKNPKLELRYALADAELFAQTIKTGASGLFDRVTVKKLLTDQTTTRDSIIQELRSIRALTSPDDLFVFYVASHGTVDEGEYFLITSNVGSTSTARLKTDALSQTTLKELISNIPATKKLVIIDTCNAGALGEALQVTLFTRGMSEDTAIKILGRAVGSTILSASTSLQEALEGYQGHGIFTYVVTEGMRGKADKGKSGFIRTTDLADYVDNEVPVLAEKVYRRSQYPIISISGMAFPIVKVGK